MNDPYEDRLMFQNTYLIMRHGQSEANAQGVIVSDPAIGCADYGLTELGREQAKAAAQCYRGFGVTKVFCSDFLRTRETADLAADTLGVSRPELELGLRERYFGIWDGQSHDHYQAVWEEDVTEERSIDERVESTASVLHRGIEVLKRLERTYQNEVILLVSHGDMLQILRTAFVGISHTRHRSLPHHETGEIRSLVEQGEPANLLRQGVYDTAL